MPLTERAKGPYKFFRERATELQRIADNNGGQLPRHEWWRHSYYQLPYLILEPDEVIRERFSDIYSNSIELTSDGKIAPTPMLENEARLSRLFTEIIEETNWRGILTRNSIAEANQVVRSYFQDGIPLGVRMFRDKPAMNSQWLLKFSQKHFVTEMYKFGRFRISPASFYSKGSHIRAVRDFETVRNFKIKALNQILKGQSEVIFAGQRVPITCGVVPVQLALKDYYLFSTCKEISRRMPTDFEADAALAIQDKTVFIQRLKTALLKQHPEWEFLEGDVYYFDPYNDVPKDRNLELWKHISYAYQKEHRCVLRPRNVIDSTCKLEPFFVEIGPLDDISEIIVAP